jgi:hypothetical protein
MQPTHQPTHPPTNQRNQPTNQRNQPTILFSPPEKRQALQRTSSLVKLLQRLHQPISGQEYKDGQSTRHRGGKNQAVMLLQVHGVIVESANITTLNRGNVGRP